MLLGLAALAACAGSGLAPYEEPAPPTPRPEALSLLNRPLYRPQLPLERQHRLQAQLDSAVARYEASPDDVEAAIWVGRRLAYLGRYRDAIDFFSRAIAKHPDDARLYRHRGHRYITTRQIDLAIADLERAARLVEGTPDEIEPDGQPNAANVPTSTLHGNIFYHLALARYLRGDFAPARAAWERALAIATTPDMRVAVSDWLYLTLLRLRQPEAAQRLLDVTRSDTIVIENHAYLRRLRLYRRELPPDSLLSATATGSDAVDVATNGYGLASWHLSLGDTAAAASLWRRVLENGNWAAFGYIAAEAELARRRSGGH